MNNNLMITLAKQVAMPLLKSKKLKRLFLKFDKEKISSFTQNGELTEHMNEQSCIRKPHGISLRSVINIMSITEKHDSSLNIKSLITLMAEAGVNLRTLSVGNLRVILEVKFQLVQSIYSP